MGNEQWNMDFDVVFVITIVTFINLLATVF